MIKDKLHTITDEDAITVALLLLKNTFPYDYNFVKIQRIPFNIQDGCDSEESVDVYFNAIVNKEGYRMSGWKDKQIFVKLIESDRYHDHPYFTAFDMGEDANNCISWKHLFIANQIEAIEFLKLKELI